MGGNGDSVVRMPAFQKAVLADDSLRLVVSEIQAEFRRRWAAVLGLPAGVRRLRRRAADIRSAVLAEFDAPAPGWTLVRHVSPDVLIAAPSVAAIQAGDFQLVLGEIHPGNTLASSLFLAQHESGDELVRWIQRDLPELSVLPVLPKDRYPQRLNLPLIGSAALAYEHSPEPSGCPPERILRAGDLVVRRGRGGLEICTRDLARVFDAVDFMGLYLWSLCGGMLRMTSDAAHTPRIAIDDLVICREQWRIDPATLEFAGIADPLDRFRGVRRWARDLEMPRFIFVKTPVENKPCYVDLESPVFIDLLSKLARAALEAGPGAPIVATEMLPRPDQAWLVDAQGRRYTSELRFVALDPRAVCDVRSELRVG
jgi:hypothetical protein